jgi:hypothetical protein
MISRIKAMVPAIEEHRLEEGSGSVRNLLDCLTMLLVRGVKREGKTTS